MFQKKGLIYSLLDEKGNKIGIPIKSSSLYTKPTLPFLEKQFVKHVQTRQPCKPQLKAAIDKVIASRPGSQEAFTKSLKAAGIVAVFRIGANGQAFGITYVDHRNKTVFNGSDLGKVYSAKAILTSLTNKEKSTESLQMSITGGQKSTGWEFRQN